MTITKHSSYEPVIDGMRALAVFMVILFQAGIVFSTENINLQFLPGGLTGVDIFFVISGYLITRNILTSLQAENFTLQSFYIRRIRRIIPAMTFTLIWVLAIGVIILSPEHITKLAEETFYASLGGANFLFWNLSHNTLALDANFLPALHHYWSLAIEEQFYLIWPAIILGTTCLFHKNFPAILGVILLILSIGSLCLSQVLLAYDSAAAFYMMPTRIFQFGIGAGLLWIKECPRNAKMTASLLSISGFIMIIYCGLTYVDGEPYPGLKGVLPCVGAAALIYGRHAPISQWCLGNSAMLNIGKRSYSLYLVHWPLFIFITYAHDSLKTPTIMCASIVLSIILAALMYRYIEQPFRYPTNKIFWIKNNRIFCHITLGTIIFIATTSWALFHI